MKINLRSLLALTILFAFLISGCALEHHPRFYISRPNTNSTFLQTDLITINLHRYSSITPYHYFRYQIRDNGNIVEADQAWGEMTDVQKVLNGDSIGIHLIDARAQAYDSPSRQSDWYPATSICIYVGPNPPSNFTCDIVYGWPSPDEFVTTTPSVLTITTVTPITTPLIIIRPDNNNGNSNGGNPSGATGCAAYSDKTSCDLAGCSWNGSACTVTP